MTEKTSIENPFFVKLPNRGEITISGPDRYEFLQSLITNDIGHLKKSTPLIYSCLLNAQGKFLHDFFMRDDGENLRLDCEGSARAQDLYTRFNLYRLRAKIDMSLKENISVYAVFGTNMQPSFFSDPRHSEMGFRCYIRPESIEEKPFGIWDKNRIRLAIPDGSRDLKTERSTMDEAHMDQLGAICYEKGCYIGQELTARMHYRGLGKKHIQVITTQDIDQGSFPEAFSEIKRDGKTIGEMRSSCGDTGLALLKDL